MTDSTSAHPPSSKPDATTHPTKDARQPAPTPSRAAELSSLTIRLRRALKQYPDFPLPGILFEDILPIFADPSLHQDLVRALEIYVLSTYPGDKTPDVLLGLESRGFLFGPSLALRLGAAFVPVRKQGKLPGPTETAAFEKEYGKDFFEVQKEAIKPGQKILVVDDIIATGGSAAAAGSLARRCGGVLLGYMFILELNFLKGREKLDAPVYTLLSSQDGSLSDDA
ncbi:MAG: adenine phosphoribosyltransferase [Piccolia ochrophora]|nr:MAG: adenine phosphoribosyltransferase [Piccolia ochrophora]